ncbi:MAG: AAA family ATPase [Nanoarchaeota archaeon]|nr:AAA family ATPase [Nanoarchaeota archaeon]
MGTFIKKLEKFDGPKNEALTITVSGLAGSGKTTIAQILAKETGLEYVTAGKLFRDKAKQEGMTLEKFSATRNPKVDLELDKKMLELARKGGVVLDGRITSWTAGTHAQVRIYIKGDEQEIAVRVAKRDNKPFKQALRDVKRRNKTDVKTYKKIYGVNAQDQSIYHYVLDNSFPTYAEIKKLSLLLSKILKKKFSKLLKTPMKK